MTHNIYRIERADIVWKMEHGRIIEQGPPEQVLRPDAKEALDYRFCDPEFDRSTG